MIREPRSKGELGPFVGIRRSGFIPALEELSSAGVTSMLPIYAICIAQPVL
jgi:hypothetical protein